MPAADVKNDLIKVFEKSKERYSRQTTENLFEQFELAFGAQ